MLPRLNPGSSLYVLLSWQNSPEAFNWVTGFKFNPDYFAVAKKRVADVACAVPATGEAVRRVAAGATATLLRSA